MYFRIKMKRNGLMAFLSHLELMKTLERSFKRSSIPMLYSQGFNPRPLMNFALPLSVGLSAEELLLELEVEEGTDPTILYRVGFVEGLEIVDVKEVEKGPSLMSRVARANYRISGDLELLRDLEGGEALLFKKRRKKGPPREVDARDYVLDYSFGEDLVVSLLAGSEANLRPQDLLLSILKDQDKIHDYDISLLQVFDQEGSSLW